jgi:hypothetical protein
VTKEMVGVVDCPWERRCVCTASSQQQAAAARPCDSRSQNSKQIVALCRCAPSTPCPLFWRARGTHSPLPFPRRASHFSHQIEGLALLLADARSSPAAVEQTNPPYQSRKRLAAVLSRRHGSRHLAYETCFMTTWSDPDR